MNRPLWARDAVCIQTRTLTGWATDPTLEAQQTEH